MAKEKRSRPKIIDSDAEQILKYVRETGIPFTKELQRLRAADARQKRAEAAWRRYAAFDGDAVGDLKGEAIWRREAELLVDLGKILREDGWQSEIDAVNIDSTHKRYAMAILRQAMDGSVANIMSLLKQAIDGDPNVDGVFQLGYFALPMHQCLREDLMYEVLHIERPPDSPGAVDHETKTECEESPTFDDKDFAILRTLEKHHPRRLTAEDIAGFSIIGAKTVASRLNRLIELGYATRPAGEKRGATITPLGLAFLTNQPPGK